MKHSIKAVAAAALAGFALSAHAEFVTHWSYSVSTQWGTTGADAPQFDSTGGTQYVSSSMISWGSSSGNVDPAFNSDRSGLKILNSPQSGVGTLVTNDINNPDLVATFQHINNPISSLYGTLTKATVQTTLTLTPYLPTAGDPWGPVTLTFQVNFAETSNTAGTCIPEASSVCDDVFVLSSGNLNQTFTYGGETYYIHFVDMQDGSLTSLSPEACTAAGAAHPCLGFWTAENAAETIDFGIIISGTPVTPGNPVPEPGILGLVGLGLLGAVGASRRRRKS